MLTLTALFTAILAVASWISLPLPFTPVPVNLATLAVTLAGALLGYKYGSFSVLLYILLGAVGVPVFAGFSGGLGHLAGPTGGYIVGYLSSAFICGFVIDHLFTSDMTDTGAASAEAPGRIKSAFSRCWPIVLAALLGTASCYIIGTLWFMHLTGNGLVASMAMCVIPFLPGDAFKIAAAAVTVPALKRSLYRFTPQMSQRAN